jgi:hypothetical protein
MSNEEQAEQIFESAVEMMDSIRAINGDKYARTVEITLNLLKLRDLVGHFLAKFEEHITEEKALGVWLSINKSIAHMIALSARNAEIEDTDPGQMLDWAKKIMDIEMKGCEKLMEDDE